MIQHDQDRVGQILSADLLQEMLEMDVTSLSFTLKKVWSATRAKSQILLSPSSSFSCLSCSFSWTLLLSLGWLLVTFLTVWTDEMNKRSISSTWTVLGARGLSGRTGEKSIYQTVTNIQTHLCSSNWAKCSVSRDQTNNIFIILLPWEDPRSTSHC